MKTLLARTVIIVLFFLVCLSMPAFALDSREQKKASLLVTEINKTKDSAKLHALFNELGELYFNNNDFDGFLTALSSVGGGDNKGLALWNDYYTALARYRQLKYLEDNQLWEEYFANQNSWRTQITGSIAKVLEGTTTADPLRILSRLLLWRFYQDQQDPARELQLSGLMAETEEYAAGNAADIGLIKTAADELSSYNEKGNARQLYKIYVAKIVAPGEESGKIKKAALGFYSQGNLDLAEAVYDAYIERIAQAQGAAAAPELIEIARQFSYGDNRPNDPLYAEKVFARIEELGGKEALDEKLMYLRAFNLEKGKDFLAAKDRYRDFVASFPDNPENDEAQYKLGIITTYIMRDISGGRGYFTKLSDSDKVSPQVISAIYQLGLLAQWEGKNEEARRYYLALKDKAGDGFRETVALANERIAELDGSRPIEYNLKTFIDVSLRPQDVQSDRTKFELNCHPYRSPRNQDVNISSSYYYGDNGCLQPEFQYLWSGHLGAYHDVSNDSSTAPDSRGLTKPDTSQSAFTTQYIHNGSKEVNLVIVSASGVVDRNLDIVDVYDSPGTP
ncbi:MAG: hypothetical protein WC469_01720 [Candidatus Omnitrophota bacterium]